MKNLKSQKISIQKQLEYNGLTEKMYLLLMKPILNNKRIYKRIWIKRTWKTNIKNFKKGSKRKNLKKEVNLRRSM